jgi:hypothetical protein
MNMSTVIHSVAPLIHDFSVSPWTPSIADCCLTAMLWTTETSCLRRTTTTMFVINPEQTPP